LTARTIPSAVVRNPGPLLDAIEQEEQTRLQEIEAGAKDVAKSND